MNDKNNNTYKFNAETGKVLKMMINSVYTNKDTFLRELISNSSDATEKRRCVALNNSDLGKSDDHYPINIEINKDLQTLSIIDEGIGISKEDMISHLGTIAKSGTEEFFNNLNDAISSNKAIGQFGVGFYSAFMVADKVDVISRKAGETKVHLWSSKGDGEYSIEDLDIAMQVGTKIILHIKPDEIGYLDKYKIISIIETYSNSLDAKITVKENDSSEEIKKSVAIWSRDKNKVTEDEYKSFYKSLSHLPDSPLDNIHLKIEGNPEFSALLFIPSMKPFDLFHPDRQTRVKLYVKNVFITETALDLIPKYLRFVYGVIDSSDLPLNISRETLQDSHVLGKIKDIIVKRIIKKLKELSKNEDKYLTFWENFGAVLKEGLCEQIVDKESLLELSRFKTLQSPNGVVSLDQYLENFKGDKKTIYYCTGDGEEEALSNPQLEAFRQKGIDVLILSDAVDFFWLNVVSGYKDIEFKSVSRSDITFDDESEGDKDEGKDAPEEEKDNDLGYNKNDIIEFFKKSLEGKIKDVKISKKLVESPACLSFDAGSMDLKMERYLVEQNQLPKVSLKTLEVNDKSHLIKKAIKLHKSEQDGDKAKADKIANIVLNIACISQGEPIKASSIFVKDLLEFL